MTTDPIGAGASERPDRRARRKAETHARLLDAARRHFVAHGYDGTRPQDIAQSADVAVGTFYAHFSDKRGAFLAFTEQAARELMERMRAGAGAATGFEERLYGSLDALLAYADANPGVLQAAFADAAVIAAGLPRTASLQERFARRLAEELREGGATGRLHVDADPEILAHGIVGFIQQGLAHGAARGTERRRLLAAVTHFIARGLAPRSQESPQ